MHNRSHLRIVLFHIALRDGKQVTLCLLHQLIDIYALVESLRLDVASIMDELASQILLRQDTGVRLDMGSGSHLHGDFHQILSATHVLNLSHLGEFIIERQDIDRSLVHVHLTNRLIYLLMTRFVEGFRFQNLRDNGERIRIDHQRTEHHSLQFDRLWLNMSEVGVDGRRTLSIVISSIIWHNTLFII